MSITAADRSKSTRYWPKADNCLPHSKYTIYFCVSPRQQRTQPYIRSGFRVARPGLAELRSVYRAQWQQQPSSCFLSGYLTGPDKAARPASVSSCGLPTTELTPHSVVVKLSGHDRESKAQWALEKRTEVLSRLEAEQGIKPGAFFSSFIALAIHAI